MQTIRRYWNEVDATHAREKLEAEEIAAYIENASAQTALSYLGVAAGGVRLLVAAQDVERAEEVLEAETDLEASPAWRCGACMSEVDEGFDTCWKCGGDRSVAYVPEDAPTAESESSVDSYSADVRDLPTHEKNTSLNPYYPAEAETVPNPPPREIPTERDEVISRAMICAVIGTCFLPVVLHLYSIYHLATRAPYFQELSRRDRIRFTWVGALDVAAIIIGFVIMSGFFR